MRNKYYKKPRRLSESQIKKRGGIGALKSAIKEELKKQMKRRPLKPLKEQRSKKRTFKKLSKLQELKNFIKSRIIQEGKINELDLGQKASGFLGRSKAFLSNLMGKSDAGQDVAQDLKAVGLGTGGFTAYISSDGYEMFENPEIQYIIDEYKPTREDILQQKVKYTLHQIQTWKPGSPFLAIQSTFDLKDEEPKLKGKVHALNFGTGKYDFIKDFEEGAALGFSQSGNSDETIARFKDDIDRMTDKPSTATVEEIMYMLKDKHDFGIEQPDSLKVNEAKIIIKQLLKKIK